MSISEDIKALEEALKLQAPLHISACTPDRIRRVLDALKASPTNVAVMQDAYMKERARLSKAIELLRVAQSALDECAWEGRLNSDIAAFLSQDSQT